MILPRPTVFSTETGLGVVFFKNPYMVLGRLHKPSPRVLFDPGLDVRVTFSFALRNMPPDCGLVLGPLEFHFKTARMSIMLSVSICEHSYLCVRQLLMPSRAFPSRQTSICALI